MTADATRDRIVRLLIPMDAHTGDSRVHDARAVMEAWVASIDLTAIAAALPAAPAGVTVSVMRCLVGSTSMTLVPNGPGADHPPYTGPRGTEAVT
jgi:hypothetical protein